MTFVVTLVVVFVIVPVGPFVVTVVLLVFVEIVVTFVETPLVPFPVTVVLTFTAAADSRSRRPAFALVSAQTHRTVTSHLTLLWASHVCD